MSDVDGKHTLQELCEIYRDGVGKRDGAIVQMIWAEEQIMKLLPEPSKAEGTVSHPCPGGWNVKVVYGLDRKLDEERWALIVDEIPEELRPVKIKTTSSIELKGLRYLEKHKPEVYKQVCVAITTKPKKPSFTVEKK